MDRTPSDPGPSRILPRQIGSSAAHNILKTIRVTSSCPQLTIIIAVDNMTLLLKFLNANTSANDNVFIDPPKSPKQREKHKEPSTVHIHPTL